MTFKYQGKIITTPNLEKKLKRMKISIDDIEILEEEIISKQKEDGLDGWMEDKIRVIVRSNIDDIRRVCYISKDYRPTIKELFKNHLWNPQTKTGIKEITEEYLMTLYYEN